MKLQTIIKKAAGIAIVFGVTAAIALFAVPAFAVPYQGEDTPPLPAPAFNKYTGVPSVGNEADFFRGRESGQGEFINNVTSACNNGQEFSLRIYVHNGASQHKNNNGTGPSVAKNTKVRVALPGSDAASSFPMDAFITSSNAGNISDDMTITCNDGKQVKLSYVPGSAIQVNTLSGTKPLSDSIVTTGAPIGTMAPNGDVWGCWEQRVWVYLKVKVKDVPPKPPVEKAVCEALNIKLLGDRRVQATVNASVQNAEVVDYEIEFGDGTKVNEQTAEHTYAEDGTYQIVGRVLVRFDSGEERWITSDQCAAPITFKEGKPTPPTPEQPMPEVLPNAGVGDLIGIFAATTVAGTIAYRLILARRFN